MWAGDHDLWDPSYISRCTSVLEEDPTVVLAYSRTMLVDLEGDPIELLPDQIDTRGMTSSERYVHLIRNLRWCNMVYGVIRRESLKQTGDAEAWKLRVIEGLDPDANSNMRKTTLTNLYRALRNEHLWLIRSSSFSRREKLRTMMETLRCYESNFGVEWPGGRLFRKIRNNRVLDSLLRKIRLHRQRRLF